MSSPPATAFRPPLPPVKTVPHASTCPRCAGPIEPGDRFCASCGLDNPSRAAEPAAEKSALTDGFRCENCGAEVRCEPGSRATTCPFCAAPYVVELPPRLTGRQDPEFVLGFECPKEKAETIYRQWLGAWGLFRPGDLAHQAQADGLRGIYLPFWSFSVRADSRWRAEIGEHWYRTETYTTTDANGKTVTQTRQVTETEWYPLEGGHHAYYSFYLVSGSKGLPQGVAEWVQPYQLGALKRYAPGYLAGWLSEEYTVEKDAAFELSQAEFHRREQEAISAFLPGDTHRGVVVQTEFSQAASDLILVPIYLRSYRYKGKVYRILINGQTGKIEGEKPISPGKIATAVALVVVLILIVWLLISGVGR